MEKENRRKKEGKEQLPKQLKTSDEEETRRCFSTRGKLDILSIQRPCGQEQCQPSLPN
jgi:hypothetical protein